MRRLALILCALLMPLAAWAEEENLQPVLFDPAKPHTLAYAPAEEPEWMPELLTKLHHWIGPSYKLKQHVLFRWKGEPAWLAMVTRSDDFGDKLTLFHITAPGEAKAVMTIKEDTVEIIEPSGSDGFGDGTPQLAVYYGCGGSAWFCYGVASLHLDERVRDATPMDTIPYAFSKNGHYLIAMEDEWDLVPSLQGSNHSITIPLARKWNGHAYVEACDELPSLYEPDDWELKPTKYNDMSYFLERKLHMALKRLEGGLPHEAARLYRWILMEAPHKDYFHAEELNAVRKAYDPIFLKPHPQSPCPLSPPPTIWRRKAHAEMMRPVPSPYHP